MFVAKSRRLKFWTVMRYWLASERMPEICPASFSRHWFYKFQIM